MRAALYARFSDRERQNESSIEQQVRLLRDRAEREGWEIVGNYEDKGLTGANRFRAGLQELTGAIHAREFDILLTESIDRLSRDQEDIAYLYKRCCHNGIQIVTLLEGEITELHVGLKGTMSALYLKDLGRRTHRGLEQRALEGESTGGRSYGYEIETRFDAKKGRRVGGIIRINPYESPIVKRIFREYVAGKSPRQIALDLNAEEIPAQSGRPWAASTINGNRRRGTGLLNNELYIGRKVWGKQSYFKDPDTGRETGRLNDESKWIRTDVPHLRIIDDELWEAVKRYQGELDLKPTVRDKKRPQRLFSFLLKCGDCGGGMSKISATQYGCSSARNTGICKNRLTISERKLEASVLGSLQTQLMQPELCEVFCAAYADHVNQKCRDDHATRDANQAEFERTERDIAKLVQAIKSGVDPALLKDEINALQKRKLVLEAALDAAPAAPVFIHPNMAARFHEGIQNLIARLNDPKRRQGSAEMLRGLIEKIVLKPNEDRTALVVDLQGRLRGILELAAGQEPESRGGFSRRLAYAASSEIETARRVVETVEYEMPPPQLRAVGSGVTLPPQPNLTRQGDDLADTSVFAVVGGPGRRDREFACRRTGDRRHCSEVTELESALCRSRTRNDLRSSQRPAHSNEISTSS
jgi:DNA invertase Pin-like site-specific DNA recombinase